MSDNFPSDIDEKDFRILSREDLEAEIERRTSYLENVMDTMVDLLLRLDTQGRIDMCNKAVTDILGYDPDVITGNPVDMLFADPDENEQLADMLTQGELFDLLFSQGHVTDVGVSFQTKDGRAIPMSLSASLITEDDKPVGIVCVAKDISERKEAEERAEFLHSLLRHDLGNKMQVIHGHLGLLDDYDVPEEITDHVETSMKGVDEALELIENVRTLSSIEGDPELLPIELHPILKSCIERNEDLRMQQDIEIITDFGSPVSVLGGSIIKELFSNLIENSLNHSDADEIHIRTEVSEKEVRIIIEDDGVGVPDEKKEEIFQKGVKGHGSSGSGLGMHLASEIAGSYGGNLEVKDSDLGGARFDVTLQRP